MLPYIHIIIDTIYLVLTILYYSIIYLILRYKMNAISLFQTLFIESSIVMTSIRH